MGVPSFFRWLHRRYPLVISNCIEKLNDRDAARPNPNTEGDREFDCLYLDMNGIIHPCFHPEGVAPPRSESEIFANIERYILRLFNIVRPRILLYMAIDGVAPRAKMNQQRMRRYRSAKENEYNRQKRLYKAKSNEDEEEVKILSDPDYLEKHDSNVITPGTPFFQRLSNHLKNFIKEQQANDPAWKSISVILSDAGVPGEGEHKIMSFVRSQRLQRGYDPNRRHVIYGLDADLIFLALASHEQYFTIIREDVIDTSGVNGGKPEGEIGPEFFHFVNLWVLRQYLERDLRPPNMSFEWNLERAIDDFIFLCFAAGNDFIPSMPGFSVHGGAVNAIISTYKNNLAKLGCYLTMNGGVDFPRFAEIMSFFVKGEGRELESILFPTEKAKRAQALVNKITFSDSPVYDPKDDDDENDKRKSRPSSADVPNIDDMKKQYYMTKFQFVEADIPKLVPLVVEDFIRGMIWTLNYYIHGCPSWNWYYHYHYSPCVSDFVNFSMDHSRYSFTLSEPFKPLVQLMSVLPPQSAHCLPPVMKDLMCSSTSPLKDFYPTKFRVDLNGSTATWHGTVKVPFIDEDKLMSVLKSTDLKLTPAEEIRNTFGEPRLFMSSRVAPPKELTGVINVDGPYYWGKLERARDIDKTDKRDSEEFIYRQVQFDPRQFVSFQLPGVILPPWVLDYVYDDRKYSTYYDKGAFDQSEIERANDLPLQLPGYVPGTDQESRSRRVARARYIREHTRPSHRSGPPPPPPPPPRRY